MVTIVLLNEAWMCAIPWDTCLRSFFLNVFFLPFFSGAAGPPAAAGFAIVFQSLVDRRWSWPWQRCQPPRTNDERQFLRLRRCLLLRRNRALARAFAGSGVGVRTLSTNRQIPAMAIPAVGTDFDEPLDVHRNFLAQIAFDQPFGLDYLTDAVHLVLAEVLDLLHWFDLGLIEDAGGA